MTTSAHSDPTTSGTDPLQAAAARLGQHWALPAIYGAVTIVLGVLVLAWPGATLLVAATVFAIQLLIGGVVRIAQAIAAPASGGVRTLLALIGTVSILVGLLCLRSPLRTLVAIALLVGASWLVNGILEIVTALGHPDAFRTWRLVIGALSVVAAVYVLLNPAITLIALVWIIGIWLLAQGGTTLLGALTLRRTTTNRA